MLVPGHVMFAVRCPQCGKMENTSVSLFDFSGASSVRLSCSCGTHKLTVGIRPGQVWLQVPCYLCDGQHFAYYNRKRFWSGELLHIVCSETDLQLGVCGSAEEVAGFSKQGQSELEHLLEEGAFEDYFDNPEVMYQSLGHVNELAEKGNLTCTCGNTKVEVDIFPDRLELYCPTCAHRRSVLAATEEDLAVLRRLRRIEVGDENPGRRQEHKN